MTGILKSHLAALVRDLSGIDSEVAAFSLWSSAELGLVWGPPRSGNQPEGFPKDGYTLRAVGSETYIPADSPDQLAARVASVLQDHVIDRLGRGWPEVYLEGRFLALLQPSVSGGLPMWMSEKIACSFGGLAHEGGTIVELSDV